MTKRDEANRNSKEYRQRPENKARRNERLRERYAKDPAYRKLMKERAAHYRAKRVPVLRDMMIEAKASGCVACDEQEFVALDFHHREPAEKSFNVGMAVYQKTSITPARFQQEIDKCIVLCVNCHRKYHAGKLVLPDA